MSMSIRNCRGSRTVRAGVFTTIALVIAAGRPASGQSIDLGRVFEKAARKVARDAIVGPGGVAQAISPEASGARSRPVTTRTADGWTLVAHHYPPGRRSGSAGHDAGDPLPRAHL